MAGDEEPEPPDTERAGLSRARDTGDDQRAERADASVRPGTAPSCKQRLEDIGLEAFAPYLMNRISARYNADMAEILRAHGLTTAQMRALAVLAVYPGVTVNELAVYAVMEQSTMSRTLDGMTDAGLAERKPRKGDGRVREVALTDAGHAAFDEVWPLMQREEERMFQGVGRREREAFLHTLSAMLINVRKHPL